MGQHTWFVKNKNLYLKSIGQHESMDRYEDDAHFLQVQIDEIDGENDATSEYHDLFRTWKRDSDGYYTEDILTKETYLKWMEDNKDVISFKHAFDDTAEREEELRIYAMEKLEEFFNKYPNGAIYFG